MIEKVGCEIPAFSLFMGEYQDWRGPKAAL